MKRSLLIYLLVFTVISGCKKNYTPAAVNYSTSYLVVEGVINPGSDSTFIKLSRSVNIATSPTSEPVTGATVSVESDQGKTYSLIEIAKGSYAIARLNLDSTLKYRLSIKTTDKKEYASDFEGVKITPPIDSIGFTPTNRGLQIYVNAHDANNATHYYRWQYKENWRFHAAYFSQWMSDGKEIIKRPAEKNIYYCFANQTSSSVVLGSSAKLTKDLIYQSPITLIPSTSEKIEDKYTILLYQYALTTEAYNFWVNLKTNTEQLGSIFDAQPSNINGNMHNVNNADEVVIGYISISSVKSKRVYITRDQLPSSWAVEYPYKCSLDSEYYVNPHTGAYDVLYLLTPISPIIKIPVSDFYQGKSSTPLGFFGAAQVCVDCTIRGNVKQPDFWK